MVSVLFFNNNELGWDGSVLIDLTSYGTSTQVVLVGGTGRNVAGRCGC